MNKDIKYSGYSAVPSDHECADGELAASSNLIFEDGALKLLPKPGIKFSIDSNLKLLIHRVGSVANYIAYRQDGSLVQWIAAERDSQEINTGGKFDSPRDVEDFCPIGEVVSVAAVGYILIFSTRQNLYYIRFNASKDAYVFLGSKVPDIDISLALKLNFTSEDTQRVDFTAIENNGSEVETTTGDDDWQTMMSQAYVVSVKEGSLHKDPDYSDRVTTGIIPLDSTLVLKKGVEYKFSWNIYTPNARITLAIYGKRNGSSQLEQFTGMMPSNAAMASVETWTKVFDDEWTDIAYKITLPDTIVSDAIYRGVFAIYKGLDNSETGSGDVPYYIKYTADTHDAIMGVINKFVNTIHTEKNKFIYPFFVRYAVKMFDGTYSKISEPVLMIPNSGYCPIVNYSKHWKVGTRIVLSAFAADLRYKLQTAIPEKWRDIIVGVDIFASLPIWTYNQGQSYDGSKNYFKFFINANSYGFGKVYYENNECDTADDVYQKLPISDYIGRYHSDIISGGYVQLAPRPNEDIMNDVELTSDFRKVASIDFDELNKSTGSYTEVKLKKGVVSTLAARESLHDNILHYEGFVCGNLKEYNRRLNICHSKVLLPRGKSPDSYFNAYYDTKTIHSTHVDVYIFLATEDGEKVVKHTHKTSMMNMGGPWFYYPDSRAYKAVVVFRLEQIYKGVIEIPLTCHQMLAGAYWLGENLLDNPIVTPVDDLEEISYNNIQINNTVSALSSIYVSETNNPFSFLAPTVVSVGAREVLALSSSARALSQGQFGQFPLYAFSSEGIWALSVNDRGSYSAVQPIVRDETIDINSITQIDAAVLFASSRGIILLSGSQTQCISDTLNSDSPFSILTLPHMGDLHRRSHNDKCLPTKPFYEFIKKCRMLYDYPHQRIIIYNPKCEYAYVYSLRSKAWGMMLSDIDNSVNSYPDAYALSKTGQLLDFSSKSDGSNVGIFVTRPLKLDAPDILKTIDTVIQRGFFRKGHVQSVLYGSRDLYNWHLVWSSKDHFLRGFRGTPYKYFRIACVTSLAEDESVSGASIQFTPKLTNQPR